MLDQSMSEPLSGQVSGQGAPPCQSWVDCTTSMSCVNRRALVAPLVSIKSDTCGADRRRDPTPKHTERIVIMSAMVWRRRENL
jgi:hypothetical protein